MKTTKIIGLGVIIIFTHLLFFSSCILQMRKPEKEFLSKYQLKQDTIFFANYSFANRNIHYAFNGTENSDTVLFFVHGSPGAWDAFEYFVQNKELRSKYLIISVDRPGYGYSDFGKKEESLSMQSWVYAPLLKKLHDQGKKIILVGHSYGGPVVAKMAMDYGNVISGVIFIAASLDPTLEPRYWVQKPATWPLIRWMIPKALVVSNEEIIALKPQLAKVEKNYKNIKMPIIFVQGGKDNLVHPDNRLFAERLMVNTKVDQMYYPELDHFIPFMQQEIVMEAIAKMTQRLAAENLSKPK